ncbi:hypothetical protein ILYODFUR_010613 [Ilyodon furcidens]|uniref:Uncharacterized protein n=1 Tax=Ilyodon furcidens TaxID=33524 RepID=A0ABV0TA86_9TELE
MLEGLYITAGLGAPWATSGGAGGGFWREGSLGVSTESAAPTTRTWMKRKTTIQSPCCLFAGYWWRGMFLSPGPDQSFGFAKNRAYHMALSLVKGFHMWGEYLDFSHHLGKLGICQKKLVKIQGEKQRNPTPKWIP